MLHQNAQDGQIIDVPTPPPYAVPIHLLIPEAVFDVITDIADANGQSVEATILAQLDKFMSVPFYVTLAKESLDFLYYPTGKSLAQVLGPVRSVRLEVIR